MTTLEIVANAIGVLAAVIFVLSYQAKRRYFIVLLGAVARTLFVLQYVLLGAFEGAALDILAILAALVAQQKGRPFFKKYLPVFIVITHVAILVTGVLLYENIFSLFVLLATTLHVGALWFTKEKNIRRLCLLGSPCWLVYNVASKAYPSAVSDFCTICSLLLAIFRYDLKRKKAPTNTSQP